MIENNEYLESRRKKAKKIVSILSEFHKKRLGHISRLCLDVGSNIGIITAGLSSWCNKVIGIDLSYDLVKLAKSSSTEERATYFLVGDGLSLPFRSEAFDLVVCAQVYEHTRSPALLFQEIYRVLRPGAICFFSGPNRLWFYEYHYGWYFLHWLPRKLLDTYLLRVYGKSFDLNLLSYWQIRKMCSMFEVVDYGFYVAYELGGVVEEESLRKFLAALIPRSFARYFPFLLPNFNWILVKR